MVSGEAEKWSTAMFGNRLLKRFGDDLHKDVEINALGASQWVASEFLDAVIQKDTEPNGYQKFHMSWFTGLRDNKTFDESVLERL